MVGSIGFSIPNFRGMGQQLDFAWDFGQTRKTVRAGFSEPWLFGSRTSMGLDIYHSISDWTTYYDEGRRGAALKAGRRLKWPDDYFRIYGTYRWEQIEYTNIDPNYSDPAGLRTIHWPRTTSSLSFSLTRDSRDLPEFATKGSVHSYGFEVAGGPLGGDDEYYKHTFDSYWYFPVYKKLSLMLKGQGGIVRSFGKSRYVPFFERFFPGGTSYDGQIRGYDDRSVGPRSQGTEIGGQTMLIFTIEGQFPIVEHQIYGVLFADAGNAWSSLSDTDPFSLQRSAGLGIRIVAPMIGLIGIDLAYRLDDLYEQKRGEWQPHFQMGTSF
jgi:outer membrane protein insertion porin family